MVGGHHLILGRLTDFITGETLEETHDERDRQKIARYLVSEKGYDKDSVVPRRDLIVRAGEKKAVLKIDFCVLVEDKVAMIIQYGPGSLVTRQRSTLAMARLIMPYEVPVAVVTNGRQAHIINCDTGGVVAEGLENIPAKQELASILKTTALKMVSPERFELEQRIVYAYEVDGSCPCDDTICRL